MIITNTKTDQFGLRIGELEQIIDIIASNDKVLKAVIYGSRAKGNFKPWSDIDLFIDGENLDLSDTYLLDDKFYDLDIPQKVDISLKKYINNSALLDHIERVGKIIYQK